jgi:hypothetical protein
MCTVAQGVGDTDEIAHGIVVVFYAMAEGVGDADEPVGGVIGESGAVAQGVCRFQDIPCRVVCKACPGVVWENNGCEAVQFVVEILFRVT